MKIMGKASEITANGNHKEIIGNHRNVREHRKLLGKACENHVKIEIKPWENQRNIVAKSYENDRKIIRKT